jgi:multiple sugar transport system permease protein
VRRPPPIPRRADAAVAWRIAPRILRRPSAWHLVLVPIALVMAAPFFWMLLTSLQTLAESRTFPPVFPDHPHLQNYFDAVRQAPFARWFLNSTIVASCAVAGNLLFCSLAGYAFARLRFFGSWLLFAVMLATIMVPFQVVMIPTLLIVRDLGLSDTIGALIVPNLITPIGIFMLRQFFLTLPIELEEAARMDGASRVGVLFKVVLPNAKPILATLAVITFLWSWNDFLWPLIAVSSPDQMTLQLGLASFQGAHQTKWPILMAGTLLSQIPMILVFLFAQRWFVRSLAYAGLKG